MRLLQSIRSSAFVKRERELQSAAEIIWWWEARRLLFNAVVGATGIVTLVAIVAIGITYERLTGRPFGLPDPPIFAVFGVVLFSIAANVCYTGGWIAEWLIRRAWPQESNGLATIAFTLGMVLSVIVTLLPIPLLGLLMVVAMAIE